MDSSSATYLMSSSSDEDLTDSLSDEDLTDSLSDEDLTDSSSDDDLEMLAIGIAAYQMLSHRGLNLNKNPRQTVNMATLRNLKIKTGTCKRILKELSSYEKEVEREATKTADMKEKGADPYDLKQQENVLAESRMMIPDCHKRLEASLADLKGTLEELEESGQKEGQEIDEARSIISEVETLSHTTEA